MSLDMTTYGDVWLYLADFFLEWEIFQKNVVERIKTNNFMYNFFPKIVPFMR